jgi:hypothetical protein
MYGICTANEPSPLRPGKDASVLAKLDACYSERIYDSRTPGRFAVLNPERRLYGGNLCRWFGHLGVAPISRAGIRELSPLSTHRVVIRALA